MVFNGKIHYKSPIFHSELLVITRPGTFFRDSRAPAALARILPKVMRSQQRSRDQATQQVGRDVLLTAHSLWLCQNSY